MATITNTRSPKNGINSAGEGISHRNFLRSLADKFEKLNAARARYELDHIDPRFS